MCVHHISSISFSPVFSSSRPCCESLPYDGDISYSAGMCLTSSLFYSPQWVSKLLVTSYSTAAPFASVDKLQLYKGLVIPRNFHDKLKKTAQICVTCGTDIRSTRSLNRNNLITSSLRYFQPHLSQTLCNSCPKIFFAIRIILSSRDYKQFISSCSLIIFQILLADLEKRYVLVGVRIFFTSHFRPGVALSHIFLHLSL